MKRPVIAQERQRIQKTQATASPMVTEHSCRSVLIGSKRDAQNGHREEPCDCPATSRNPEESGNNESNGHQPIPAATCSLDPIVTPEARVER